MSDFTLAGEGNLYLLFLNTDAARAWADKRLKPEAQRIGEAVAVDGMYMRDIISAIVEEGLTLNQRKKP